MYVTAVYVNLAYLLSCECKAESQHTVCGRVLRPDVYHVFIDVHKVLALCNGFEFLVLLNLIGALQVFVGLACKAYGVYCLVGVVVLA